MRKRKPTLTFLIRGFTFKKNYVPLSVRKLNPKYASYTQDFRKNIDKYIELKQKLSKIYSVSTVVSTYSSTNRKVLIDIKDQLDAQIFLSPEKGSRQFTTPLNYFNSLNGRITTDYLLLLRSDLFLTDLAVNHIAKHVPKEGHVSVFWRPPPLRKPVQNPDHLHFMGKGMYPRFFELLSSFNRWPEGKPVHAHMMSILVPVDFVMPKQIVPHAFCTGTSLCFTL